MVSLHYYYDGTRANKLLPVQLRAVEQEPKQFWMAEAGAKKF